MTSGDNRADRLIGKALKLTDAGDHPGALSALEQALELTPDWPQLHFLVGQSALASGRRDRAVGAFSRYLALAPVDRHGAAPLLALLGAAPQPDALPVAYVTALHDEYAPRFERSLVTGLGYQAPDDMLRVIDRLRDPKDRFRAALDLGCGTGLMGERLRPRSQWLEGVDLSAAMIERAAAKGVYDALHVAEMVTHLGGATRRFDIVTATDVLIYVGSLAAFFAAVSDCLAEAGLLALTVEAAETDGPEVDLRLRPSRRFAHSAGYVMRGAAAAGLALRHVEGTTLRRDAAATIEGHIMVFEKPAAPV